MHLYEDEEQKTALDWLRDLHYQICNGGIGQACYNGYVDDVIDAYGDFESWVDQLKKEVDETTNEGKMAIKAATMISNIVNNISKVKECGECGGSGYNEFEEEDEDGEITTTEERCPYCNGDGYYDVDKYSEADIDENGWDSEYYTEIDSDVIDDLTNQSHTHSVVLDAIRGVKEAMQFKEAKQILNENGYRLVEDSQEISVNALENGKYIKRLMKLYNNSGYLYLYDVITAVESDDEQFYVIKGEHYGIEVKVHFVIRDDKFNITILGLDETEGYDWVELGNGISKSFKDAANQALTEFKTNIKPLFNKVNNI